MLILIIVLLALYVGLRIYQNVISPPYYLDVYFGLPGAGKSTMAAWLTKRDLKKKKKVWSNVPVKGAYILNPPDDIGKFMIHDGRIIIDEAGIEYNNRDWKKFSRESLEYYKKHRHYKVNVSIFSQVYDDFDVKLRGLAARLFIIKPSLLPFCIKQTRIRKRMGVNETTKDIVDEYYLSKLEFRYIFSPPLWNMFSSFEHKVLPEKDWEVYQ